MLSTAVMPDVLVHLFHVYDNNNKILLYTKHLTVILKFLVQGRDLCMVEAFPRCDWQLL